MESLSDLDTADSLSGVEACADIVANYDLQGARLMRRVVNQSRNLPKHTLEVAFLTDGTVLTWSIQEPKSALRAGDSKRRVRIIVPQENSQGLRNHTKRFFRIAKKDPQFGKVICLKSTARVTMWHLGPAPKK
ncbi:hypothetical protein PT974_12000 [Cladobotryum mycophilum]|uniref:Uncharacterized protein n=1 Tax=Cladobotryum mycophilum TaxID=491253 RepID=A0ABR0S6T6_9HYPO